MSRNATSGLGVLMIGAVVAGCSSADPAAYTFGPRGGARAGTSSGSGRDAGTGNLPPPAAPSASPPPSTPPPILATDASAGGTPLPDSGTPTPPPTTDNGCGTPKCGQSQDGCGCVGKTAAGDVSFLGCNADGCACGTNDTVSQTFDQPGACDSDAALLAAWQMCSCP